ncbi:MAG: diguanylate cyclase [Nitrospira sp.]|nr:diguanylate cyclase [bacterium]MBL7049179.1 diguanylate cyclase [Nitrospira sp.]
MRLLFKLLLGFAIVALLSFVTEYYSLKMSKAALQKSIGENYVIFAEESLDKIDRTVHNSLIKLRSYANYLSGKKDLLELVEAFEKISNKEEYIKREILAWEEAPNNTVSPFMQAIIDNEMSEEIREELELKVFYEQEYGYRIFEEILITNAAGVNIAQTSKTDHYYHADEEWWQAARKDGQHVSDVEIYNRTGHDSIAISVRINDKAGNLLGIMRAVLTIEEIRNILEEITALQPDTTKNSQSPIKNNHEAHGHHGHNTMSVKLFKKSGEQIYSNINQDSVHSRIIADSFWQIASTSDSGYFIRSSTGHHKAEVLFSFAHSRGYKHYPGLGWTISIGHDTGEIFAPVIRLKDYITTISLIVTAIAIAAGLIISTSITRPIQKLRDATIRIGRGEWDTSIDIHSHDEIGQLAESFRQMTENLNTTTVKHDQLAVEISQRKKLEQQLRDMSLTDELTGLYNRRGLTSIADHLLKMARRGKNGVFLLFADLDNMKTINDSLGHDEGDNALRDTAEILKKTYRESDVIARLGGDEFAVVPVGTDKETIDIISSRLRHQIDIHNEVGHRKYTLSLSIGIAYFDPDHPLSLNDLLKQADTAMYQDKKRKKQKKIDT